MKLFFKTRLNIFFWPKKIYKYLKIYLFLYKNMDANNIIKISDIAEKFLKKKRERKKIKLKEIGKKQRVQKKSSKKNTILNKIFNKKNIDNNAIDQVLAENNIEISDDTRKYFFNLSKLKSDYSRTISLPANLVSNRISFFSKYSAQSVFITSDALMCGYQASSSNLSNLLKIGRINSLQVASLDPILLIDNETTMYEYYLEDFNKNFSFFSVVDKNSLNYEEVFNSQENILNFTLNNINYNSKGNKNFILINESKMNNEVIKSNILNSVFLKKEKGEIKQGLKPIKKGSGLYYFQQKINTVDFSPSYLVLNKVYNFNFLVKVSCNTEDLFNYLYNNIKNNKNFGLDNNFITVTNLDDFMTLVIILTNLLNIDYKEIIESYNKCRENIFYIKQDYLLFKQMCLSFYDNFSLKLNLDRLASTLVLATNYKTKAETYLKYYQDNDLNSFKTMLNNFGKTLYNFINLDKISIANMIIACCDAILNDKIPPNDDIENIVRDVGKNIYNLLSFGNNNVINEVRSPYSFLTNLVGNDPDLSKGNLNIILKRLTDNNPDKNISEQMMEYMDIDGGNKDVKNNMLNMAINALVGITDGNLDLSSINTVNTILNDLKESDKNFTDYNDINIGDYSNEINNIYTALITKLKNNNFNISKEQFNDIEQNRKNDIILALNKLYYLHDLSDTLVGLYENIDNDKVNYYNYIRNIIYYIMLFPYNNSYDTLIKFILEFLNSNNIGFKTWINSNIELENKNKEVEQYLKRQVKDKEKTGRKKRIRKKFISGKTRKKNDEEI